MWFDLIVIGVLIVFTIRGAVKGFVYQLATIAALVLCFLFSETIALAVAPSIPLKPDLNWGVAMIITYLVLSFAAFFVARQLREWMEKAKFEEYDRHLGAIFGLIKGGVLSLVMTFFIVVLIEPARDQVLNSRSGYAAAIVMDRLHPVIPDGMHAILEPYIHQLDRPGMPLHAHADDPTTEPSPFDLPDEPGTWDRDPDPNTGDDARLTAAEIWNEVEKTLWQLPAEAQSGFLERIRNLPPDEMLQLALDMRRATGVQGSPTPDPVRPASPYPTEAVDVDRLLREIAERLTNDQTQQTLIVREVQRMMTGVPLEIVDPAIYDWHVDLFRQTTDPDPGTDLRTSIDDRLRRQRRRINYPLDQLSFDLRDRLR